MLGFSTKIETRFKRVRDAADRAVFKNIRHAAFSIRKYVRESIKKSKTVASEPGNPVKTRGRRGNVRNAIFVAADKDTAIIGPRYSFVGEAMYHHEFGKPRGKRRYPERPTTGPGLTANTDRFANSFAGSIGE